MNDVSKETLEAFVAKAHKLIDSRFNTLILEGLEVTFSFKREEGLSVEYKGPDAESIDAFILTFRFFIQQRERI